MERLMRTWCETLLDSWQGATVSDFGTIAVMIIVTGWLIGSLTSR
jgi:hypothetical protein